MRGSDDLVILGTLRVSDSDSARAPTVRARPDWRGEFPPVEAESMTPIHWPSMLCGVAGGLTLASLIDLVMLLMEPRP